MPQVRKATSKAAILNSFPREAPSQPVRSRSRSRPAEPAAAKDCRKYPGVAEPWLFRRQGEKFPAFIPPTDVICRASIHPVKESSAAYSALPCLQMGWNRGCLLSFLHKWTNLLLAKRVGSKVTCIPFTSAMHGNTLRPSSRMM